jgi:hypothetical protein
MPPRSGELSVVHSTGLSHEALWQTGQETVGNSPGRNKIHGRADVPVSSFLDVSLRAVRDDQPFSRHTSIVGWPIESDENGTKAHWKEICLKLSLDERINLVLATASATNI